MTNFATEDTTLGTGVGITPFFHSYGFLTMVYNLLRGLKLVVISKFNLRQFLEIIQNYKVRQNIENLFFHGKNVLILPDYLSNSATPHYFAASETSLITKIRFVQY